MLHATIMQDTQQKHNDSRVDSHLVYTNMGAWTDDQGTINTQPHNAQHANKINCEILKNMKREKLSQNLAISKHIIESVLRSKAVQSKQLII